MSYKKTLISAAILLALAVALGAFGAHGLENSLSTKALQTYQTGVRYHFYHGFGLFIIGILQAQFSQLNLKLVSKLHLAGIILFSFNCYLYAVTGVKTFAMIVPFGGVSFIAGWVLLAFKLRKLT